MASRTPRPRRRSVAAGGKAPAGYVRTDPETEANYADIMSMIEECDARSTVHLSRDEIEEVKRLEMAFYAALKLHVTEQLRPQGIRCDGVLPDGQGRGFRVYCRDQQGRKLEADVSFEEGAGIFSSDDSDVKLMAAICERIVGARDKWLRRAGLL